MEERETRLVLIDGNAILHRAYHALPPLTTKTGQPVNAVYGFTSMLFKVITDLKPTHLLVCFDRPEPTFRKQIFAGYQAQRPKMDEELVSQVDLVKKVLLAMDIATYELAGYEADDLIGTLVFQARRRVLPLASPKAILPSPRHPSPRKEGAYPRGIIIVTGDRDILQLVDEQVKVYMPIKGLSEAKLYGVREVKEKYGIEPAQIVDFKALIGDASDNYPGIKGIGPKTASFLLKKFGTLEKLYRSLTDSRSALNSPPLLSEKLVKALSEGIEEAGRAKKLAKIVTNAPVSLDWEKARLGELNKPKVRELFQELEFKSFLKRMEEGLSGKVERVKKEKKENEQLRLV